MLCGSKYRSKVGSFGGANCRVPPPSDSPLLQELELRVGTTVGELKVVREGWEGWKGYRKTKKMKRNKQLMKV